MKVCRHNFRLQEQEVSANGKPDVTEEEQCSQELGDQFRLTKISPASACAQILEMFWAKSAKTFACTSSLM